MTTSNERLRATLEELDAALRKLLDSAPGAKKKPRVDDDSAFWKELGL